MKRAILALLGLTIAAASAQNIGELPVEIVVVKPRQIYLVPGGEVKKVRLQGNRFDLVKKVEMLRKGRKAPAVHVELKTISRGIYTLEIGADKSAEVADDYQVRFFGAQDYMYVPLDIQVIDPQHPPQLPPNSKP